MKREKWKEKETKEKQEKEGKGQKGKKREKRKVMEKLPTGVIKCLPSCLLIKYPLPIFASTVKIVPDF